MTAAAEFKRAWFVVVACMAGVAGGIASLPFYNIAAFIVPLEAEFGWSRTSITFAVGFLTLGVIIGGPIAGRLCDRHGVRIPVLASLALVGPIVAAHYWISGTVWTLYGGFLILGILGAATTSITYNRAIADWFDKGRGLALGLTLTGMGLAGMFSPPLINHVIAEHGWRAGWIALGLCSLVMYPIVFLCLKDRPADEDTGAAETAGDGDAAGHPSVWVSDFGLTRAEAMQTRQFKLLGVIFFLLALVLSGFVVNVISMLGDAGIPAEEAARSQSLIALSVIVGRLVIGQAIDHVFAPLVAFVVFMATGFGFIQFAGAGPSAIVPTAILVGLSAGAELDILAFLASRYFGLRSFSEIYGWLYIVFAVGASASAPLMNAVREATGSYDAFLYAGGVVISLSAFLFLLLGKFPRFHGQPIGDDA